MAAMPEKDYIAAGLDLARLTVATLGSSTSTGSSTPAASSSKNHGDEASRFALDTAEALQRFREELRRLATAQRPHMTAVHS